ncbi:MAG: S24 family peptidase [Pricia sp.]
MNDSKVGYIQKSDKNFRVERPVQTGFSSPATHYNEPRIDLNDALVKNASATFFVRVSDDTFQDFNVSENDVLIIDKSLVPKRGQLVLANEQDTFQIVRLGVRKNSELLIWGVITYVIKSVL